MAPAKDEDALYSQIQATKTKYLARNSVEYVRNMCRNNAIIGAALRARFSTCKKPVAKAMF